VICRELAALRTEVNSLQALNAEVTSLQEAVSVLQADIAEIRAQLDPKG
jgi:prefoldin subunit 5